MKEEKEEAEKFKAMLQNRHMLHTDFFSWQLFHVNTDINEKEDIVDDLRNEFENARNEADENREASKEANKKLVSLGVLLLLRKSYRLNIQVRLTCSNHPSLSLLKR